MIIAWVGVIWILATLAVSWIPSVWEVAEESVTK